MDYHYPFPFEIPEASESFLSIRALKLDLLLAILGVGDEETLKVHLLRSLKMFSDSLEQALEEEKKNKYKLLEKKDFNTGE